ncbi:phage/plasmid primase, P4 family [Mycolicibacterium psychrotolerans]|uniref:SF3 helicase domain-containing protein n=1 Tax=Mycolicibacterium psychrotolerans TaxID=216929 RepID=A0A7I7MBP7_9MYCO|nr:phage/plasmid primase, P4 family [Mycolicibacterium psychrotolerans]BBX69708.1 hypothetical protein MPSYJ_31690 [Mycolicibacterium psychrotolerans]
MTFDSGEGPPEEDGDPGTNSEATTTTATADDQDPTALTVPRIDPDMSPVEIAHHLHECGFHAFPTDHPDQPICIGKHGPATPCDGIRGKHPAVKFGTWAIVPTPKMIDLEWDMHGGLANTGIACGPSGLVILDEDQAGELNRWTVTYGINLPDTYTVTTGRGEHRYYRWNHAVRRIGNSAKAMTDFKIDVRGDGGYAIGEGSHHASGAAYVGNGLPVANLPDEVAEILLAGTSEEKPHHHRDQGSSWDANTSDANVAKIGYPKRHNALIAYAGRLRKTGLDYHEAEPVFHQRWLLCEQPTGQIPEATYHSADCPYPVTWDEGKGKLRDVFHRYPPGQGDDIPEQPADKPRPDAGQWDTEKHSGHLGMAVKMGAQYAGKLLYVNKIGWHRWDGKRWAPDGDGQARRAVHAVIKRDRRIIKMLKLPDEEEQKRLRQIARYESASAITGILTEAAALKTFSVTVDVLDADPYLFNCANGTLDLRTMDMRRHDPADRITKIAVAAYAPTPAGNCSTTTWTSFLATVLPDEEVRDYLQRLCGLSLIGEVNGDKQILPIITGGGANGKTTAIEAVTFALGDYAMTAEPTLLMDKRGDAHPTGVADLMGRRFVSVCETEQHRRFNIALVKWLTGGDTIKARFMRQDFFSYTPSHLMMLATNHLPRIDDDTPAVWRRIRVIPFTVQIPDAEQDKNLKDHLRAEADAVLAWIIEGWKEYRQRGGLAEPDGVLVATDGYRNDSDAVGRFIEDECDVGGAQSAVTTQALFERWERWASADGSAAGSRIAFGRALDAKGYPAETNTHDRLRRTICLKSQIEDVT